MSARIQLHRSGVAASAMVRTRVKVPPVELDGSRPTAPCLSRREAGRGKQLGNWTDRL